MLKSITTFFLLVFLLGCIQNPKKPVSKTSTDSPTTIPVEYINTVLEPVAKKLNSNEDLTSEELLHFAEQPEFRQDLFFLLTYYHREALFPKKYYNIESAAESNLVLWLSYPTELDTIPSETSLVSKETVLDQDTSFIYYVFKFRTSSPHWAAANGWMLGAVGPYLQNSKPFDWPGGTFSRLNSIDSSTPKLEAEWNHKHIYRGKDD